MKRSLAHEKKFGLVVGFFLQYWVGLPPAILGPNVLSKGVGTGPAANYFGPTCAQTIPRLPGFDHKPMIDRATAGKLRQANMIKTIQEIIDKMNKRERQAATRRPKVEK